MPVTFDTPINTNDLSIDRVLGAGLPVLLVFLDGKASTSLAGSMDRLARENAGNLILAKVDLKDNPASAKRFDVHLAPAVVAFSMGKVLSKAEGVSAEDLAKYSAYLLGKGPKPEAASRPSYAQPSYSQTRNGGRASQPSHSASGSAQAAHPQVVTDATFESEVLRSPVPVLVDFWAPWCGPCRMTEPYVDRLAGEMPGRLKIAKINVDENPRLSQQYGIQSIPTMFVVRNGQIVDRWVGALPEPAVRSRLASFLNA